MDDAGEGVHGEGEGEERRDPGEEHSGDGVGVESDQRDLKSLNL